MKNLKNVVAGVILSLSSLVSNQAIASVKNAQIERSNLYNIIKSESKEINSIDFSNKKHITKFNKFLKKTIPILKKIIDELSEKEIKHDWFKDTIRKERENTRKILIFIRSLIRELEKIEELDITNDEIVHRLPYANSLHGILKIIRLIEKDKRVYKGFLSSGIKVDSIRIKTEANLRGLIHKIALLPESDQKKVRNELRKFQKVFKVDS